MASSNPHQPSGTQPGRPVPLRPQPLPPQPLQASPPAQGYSQPGYPQTQGYPQPQGYPQTPVYPQAPGQPQAPVYPQSPVGPQPQGRPQPVAGRPRPVPVQPGAAPLPARPADQKEQEEEEGEGEGEDEELKAFAIKNAPPWLVSAVVHMVGLIVLALWVVVVEMPRNQISLESEIFAEKLGEQLEFDTPFAGNDPEKVDEPVFTPDDLKLVDNPFAAPAKVEIVPDGVTSTSEIRATNIGYALNGREEGSKKALLGAYGGTATTEAAVQRGLEWLAKVQCKDGSWSLTGPYSDGAADDNPTAATAMALLAFQGAGNTHRKGKFKKNVADGWKWLIEEQDGDGCFFHEGAFHHRFYTQGQCTIALCEIYGMTKDEKFKAPAELAIKYILQSQSSEGGWRYSPQSDSDVSVTGWIVMALQSARMAGLAVPEDHFRRVNRFLDRVSVDNGTRYPYQKGKEATTTMTAEALLCRQYLGWPRDEARLIDGLEWITQPGNLVDFKKGRNVYYWYYATQACHHMEGQYWKRWNEVMRQAVPEQQVRAGREAGSWDPIRPSRDEWEAHGGRLYVTCLSIYMLEVYYRHLPIYTKVYTVLPTLSQPSADDAPPTDEKPPTEEKQPAEEKQPSTGDGNVTPGKDQRGNQVTQQPKPDQDPAQPKAP